MKDIYMKIIKTIIPTNSVKNSLSSLFCLLIETKNKNVIPARIIIHVKIKLSL